MPQQKPAQAKRTPDDPWMLKTPPPASKFTRPRYVKDGENVLQCRVGKADSLLSRATSVICMQCSTRTAIG